MFVRPYLRSDTRVRRAVCRSMPPLCGRPEEASVLAAASAADKSVLCALGPAFVKLMLPSHIAGGYWLQVRAFENNLEVINRMMGIRSSLDGERRAPPVGYMATTGKT